MSSRFQPSEPQSIRLSRNNGANVLNLENTDLSSHHMNLRAAATTTADTCSPLRFNSLTLDELSNELDRRTKETQRLQEEVETATKVAFERFGCTYGISSTPEHSGHNHGFNADCSLGDSAVLSAHQQAVTQPLVCGLDSLNQEVSTHGKEVSENVLDDSLQQMSNLQLSETGDRHEQEAFSFDEAIVNLQTKLQRVQIEKDVLSDLRMKDSRKHVDQMEKMLRVLEEIQNIKRSGDQKRQETEDEALALNRKVETLERTIKDLYKTLLSHEKQCGHKSVSSPRDTAVHRRRSLPVDVTEDHYEETEELQENTVLSIEHLESEQCNGVNKKKERMEQLIASLGQEMAMLTDKLTSSKDNGVSLSVKLELLKKLAEGQASLHQRRVSELESTLSGHKDKVSRLEQQLIQAQTQLVNVQRENERSLRQAEELQSQLGQLKRSGEEQQSELREEVKALRGQQEVAREQLHRAREEKSRLLALLEQRDQEGRKSQEEELQRRKQEAIQHLSRLEDALSQCQILHTERETLKLKLSERDKMVEFLRLQTENSAQTTAQHGRTIDGLHQENSLLSNQLNQHKLEVQQLRADLDQHKSDLAAAEHDKRRLQASVTEQTRRVQEETLEKQQLSTRLEVHRTQLLTLTKEHKELQRLHSCKNEEHEGAVLKLQSQLRNAQADLDQVRSTLRTLEGADGHGLQVAMSMQKEITARREQVDSLHVRIQHLEETMEKLYQEKHYQNQENQRQLQELSFAREEKRQLANELEALHSKDKQLRDRISKLEAILHKMSESFTDCQDFIQLQEQEFFRLKLKHALDLKELQGQNLRTALNMTPPVLDSVTPSAPAAPPSSSSQHVSNTQMKEQQQEKKSPARELRSLVKELRGVISENLRPHTDDGAAGSGFHRRRSAPEGAQRTAFSADEPEEGKDGTRYRRRTCGSEPHFLKTAELNGKTMNDSFSESHLILSPAKYTSSPKLHSQGRRSPVHSLLTSDPNS